MVEIIEFLRKEEKEDNRELLTITNTMFGDIVSKSREIASNCEDFYISKANNTNIRFNEQLGITYIDNESSKVHKSPISKFALSQLGAKLGVPTRYLDKCISSGRIDLAQDNINSWLEDYNKDLFIREYKGSIRGVLSTKYSVCDTNEILDVVSSNIDIQNYNVKGYYLSPERFHLRLVQKTKMNVQGEDLFAGMTIDSSDVGRSVLNCRFLVFKQVCTNGLILSQGETNLFSQRHIGINTKEFAKNLASSIECLPKIITSVEERIERTRNSDSILLPNEIYSMTDQEVKDLMDDIRRDTGLSEAHTRKVISIIEEERYEANKWGYINALTDVAKDLTLEKRLDLEKYAGTLLVA